jgi:prepilin-type N-terminal cleavage/methylation domain-containing protein
MPTTVSDPEGSKHHGIARGPMHRSRRVGDADATIPPICAYKAERGLTVIELLVALAIFGVLAGIALPQFRRGAFNLQAAQVQLLSDMRKTRDDALTRGDHYRLDILSTTSYAEYHLTVAAGIWSVSGGPLFSRTLASGITLPTGAVGRSFEFNTRGLMLNPGAATTLTLTDSPNSHTRSVTVWPSGQVVPG